MLTTLQCMLLRLHAGGNFCNFAADNMIYDETIEDILRFDALLMVATVD